VDTIVVGGDVVLGPMPGETLERLRALGSRVHFLRGNCDRLVVDAGAGRLSERIPPVVSESIRWVAGQLDHRQREFLAELPVTLTLTVEGLGEVLFCHATARSDDELFTARTPESLVAPMFADAVERMVVCGHTHMPFDRLVAGRRVVNAGSVGMPYGAPGAHWLQLGPDVWHQCSAYDLAAAAERVRATGYPGAGEFATQHILQPPSAEEMLAILEPATHR
jgi:predicted phosphodiesterase